MKIIPFLIIVLACSVAMAAAPAAPPDFTREKTVADAEVIPENYMQGYALHNTGASGTIEITLLTPTRYVEFTVEAWAAQTIEIDFPADANPYLNGVQIGANNEIDVPAGAVLLVTYRPSTGTWHCERVVGLPADGNADD